jgi:PEP-CTERM motif
MRFRALITAAATLLLPGAASAYDVTFTENLVANFEFSLLGGTVINPGPTTPFIPFEAKGSLTFSLDSSINDPSHPTTVPFTNVTGSLTGVSPAPFLPYSISPDLQFLGGELTNIVRDGSGNVTSADVTDLSMRWTMVGTPYGLTLFTKDGLPFDGSTSSIPFSNGTVIAGAADFNVYLDNGGSDPLVVIGRNRTLTVVPEPSSLVVLLGTGVLGLGVFIQRRRKV